MLRGIYSAASAMSLSMQKMNLTSQNISNSQTAGYKKKTYAIHSFKDMLVQLPETDKELPVALGSYIDNAGVRQNQGRLKQTGNALDLAVMGEGAYFQLELNRGPDAPQGQEPRYTITRNGSFRIDNDNYLVNVSGDYVLDTNNQRIRLMLDNQATNQPPIPGQPQQSLSADLLQIDKYGRIFDMRNNQPRAQIKLVEWTNDPAVVDDRAELMQIMQKYGLDLPRDSELLQNLDPLQAINAPAQPGQEPPETPFSLHQGYVEESNVDITSEMIMMMMTSKDYDMSQKVISAEDKLLDKTINEMGRLQ
ncbi:MAG: flagellar hook-basal body protein [Candidatus Sericytochromatia bacterium]|nr:flagellar hook-basal body protein [Candidatus Sericytochromatia bacterium]